jgi:hypothetical protein
VIGVGQTPDNALRAPDRPGMCISRGVAAWSGRAALRP